MLSLHKIIAKKSLGQNFLQDPNVIRKIVESLSLDPNDWVLEIGCGTGALTAHLAGKVQQFIGVELDTALFEGLKGSFGGSRFLNQNVLTLDLSRVRAEFELPHKRIKVVGNLPYYISSPILEWLGREAGCIDSATIMLQAEVADRLLASPGSKEYGVLTVLTGYYFLCHRLLKVGPKAFRPRPKVDSVVVRLDPKEFKPLSSVHEASFFGFVKQCFSQRRKTLRNCLKGRVDLQRLAANLVRLKHPDEVRAEKLSLEDFVSLFLELCIHETSSE